MGTLAGVTIMSWAAEPVGFAGWRMFKAATATPPKTLETGALGSIASTKGDKRSSI